MKFFNKKEDVLDLKITPFGKELLRTGKFAPVFYAFFDDDILYNGSQGETQNHAEPRIQEDTPRLKTQAIFSGRESRIQEHMQHFIRDNENGLSAREEFTIVNKAFWQIQPSVDNNHNIMLPMGTAALSDVNVPAWDVHMLKGQILSSAATIFGSSLSTVRIPQLNCEPEYVLSVGSLNDPVDEADLEFGGDDDYPGAPGVDQDIYIDDTFIKITEDFIIMQIEEANSIFENSNFDLQVFEVNDIVDASLPNGSREELVPLGFLTTEDYEDVNSNFVEHFFEILVDQEIDDQLLCSVKGKDEKKGLYTDRIVECDTENGINKSDIYRRTVLDEDFEEPCE